MARIHPKCISRRLRERCGRLTTHKVCLSQYTGLHEITLCKIRKKADGCPFRFCKVTLLQTLLKLRCSIIPSDVKVPSGNVNRSRAGSYFPEILKTQSVLSWCIRDSRLKRSLVFKRQNEGTFWVVKLFLLKMILPSVFVLLYVSLSSGVRLITRSRLNCSQPVSL